MLSRTNRPESVLVKKVIPINYRRGILKAHLYTISQQKPEPENSSCDEAYIFQEFNVSDRKIQFYICSSEADNQINSISH